MTRMLSIVVLALSMLTTAAFSTENLVRADGPTETELKAEFKKRHAVIERLKDRGTIGETSTGLVGVVRGAGGDEEVDVPGKGKMKVKALVRDENADRRQLYALIGERTGEPPSEVAKQAALRNFNRASPNHWLELSDGRWVQKKDLPQGA